MTSIRSEPIPKDFEKTTEVLPFTKHGLSSIEEFRKAEEDVHQMEWLKKGLTDDELKLYRDKKAGRLDQYKNVETSILDKKFKAIQHKINKLCNERTKQNDNPSTSNVDNILETLQKKPITFYPEGHPMNQIKELEESLFGHLKNDIIPITKRRKILRRFERKKKEILSREKEIISLQPNPERISQPGSLWDIKKLPAKLRKESNQTTKMDIIIGPQKPVMYTIKDSKIVRLEPVETNRPEEYRAVDIVVPMNAAEAQLLEGTKMSIDDIRKIDRFKDYEPGVPSKVLYLKNIAPSVTQEQLSLLFNQFVLANGGPIELRMMSGRMRGQAFVGFQDEELAIQALEETNGTILCGRPVIAEFGRNTNRIQPDDR